MKNNIDYYQHFTDSHNHPKFKMLRSKYGWEGEGKFWALNNIIGDAENCKLNIAKDYNKASVAVDLNFSVEEFEQFLNFLINDCNLVNMNKNYITTNITQENLKTVTILREKSRCRKRGSNGSKELRESSGELKESSVEKQHKAQGGSGELNNKVKESKVKESKVKESKVNTILLFYKKLTLKTKMSKVPGEVNARLKEGYTVQEAKYVILYKYLEWWDDRKTKTWVNLTTLFRPSHFEEYLSQAEQGLDELINRRYKRFKKHWYDDNMNKPLEERKKLKLPDFKEYRQKMLGEILEVGNGESSPKTAT